MSCLTQNDKLLEAYLLQGDNTNMYRTVISLVLTGITLFATPTGTQPVYQETSSADTGSYSVEPYYVPCPTWLSWICKR